MQQLTLYIAGEPRASWPLTMPRDNKLSWEDNARIREAYVNGIRLLLKAELEKAGISDYQLMLEVRSNFLIEVEQSQPVPAATVISGIPSSHSRNRLIKIA